MKVGIIGGGSIGLLFASYLAQSNEITVYTRTEEQADYINLRGVSVQCKECNITHAVNATHTYDHIDKEEIIIIAVKQYDLTPVISYLNNVDPNKTLIFLQNGMGHIDLLSTLGDRNIVVGVVEHGARRIDETSVLHNGVGLTKLALFNGDLQAIFELMDNHSLGGNFPIQIENDWWSMLCKKLIVNAVINPLTAIFRVENGMLVQNPYYNQMMKNVFSEIISVFENDKKDMMLKQIIQICKNTANNRSSMLSDIEHGRVTEVDAILGFVLSMAKSKKIELPLTTFLYQAIKGMENKGG